jgi:hypothetical protein
MAQRSLSAHVAQDNSAAYDLNRSLDRFPGHIEGLEASTKARFEAAPKEGKARRFKEFFDGAAGWSRVERIVARRAGVHGVPVKALHNGG